MALNTLPSDATEIASVAARTALLNNGFLVLYTGSQPALNGSLTGTLLVTLTFSATAFGTPVAAAGTVTAVANAITSGTAVANGTAAYYALLKSDGTTVVLTGTVGTSGCDLNMTSTAISSGATVSCTGYQFSQLQA